MSRKKLTVFALCSAVAGVIYAATLHARETETTSSTVITVAKPAERDTVQDTVQIALVLDTSSSMDGLINQARAQLWNMVDQMGRMTRVVDGKVRTVRVELALYEYGNQTLPMSAGYIRQVLPFTSDLDTVSEKLHALYTNGGSEHAGQAIAHAVETLDWTSDKHALKFVFVAGNEEFDQGPVSAATAMKAAAAKDINVQLIHCGGTDLTWQSAAKLAKTDLMTIDQNYVAQHVPAPQDDAILKLSNELNYTYMAYGAEGEASIERQQNADVQSANINKRVALERAKLKSTHNYRNEAWDVVDAMAKNTNFLQETRDEALPSELRGKTLAEKQAIIAAKQAARAELQAKIAKLEAERTAYLAANASTEKAQSLETELVKSTKNVAAAKGYKF